MGTTDTYSTVNLQTSYSPLKAINHTNLKGVEAEIDWFVVLIVQLQVVSRKIMRVIK